MRGTMLGSFFLSVFGSPEKRPWMVGRGEHEVGCRGGNVASSSRKMASGHDELGRKPVTAEILGSLGMVDPDGEILVYLEVEMGRVYSVIVPDSPYLPTLGDLLPLSYKDPVKVGVEGVRKLQLSVLDPCMTDDHHIAPGRMDIPSEDNQTVSDRVNRFAKTTAAAAVAHQPVLPHMPSSSESPGFVISNAEGRGHGQVKPFGRPGNALGSARANPSRCQDQKRRG